MKQHSTTDELLRDIVAGSVVLLALTVIGLVIMGGWR
jgi:hypothetical protein